MFKGFGNFATLLKQAQDLRGRMEGVQEALAKVKVEGSAGGGMVTVEANAQQQLLGVKLEPALLETGDREMIEDLVLAAANQALDKAREAAAEEMSKVAGSLDLPGLGDALQKFGLGGTSTN